MGLKEINKDQSDGMVLKEKNSKGEGYSRCVCFKGVQFAKRPINNNNSN